MKLCTNCANTGLVRIPGALLSTSDPWQTYMPCVEIGCKEGSLMAVEWVANEQEPDFGSERWMRQRYLEPRDPQAVGWKTRRIRIK